MSPARPAIDHNVDVAGAEYVEISAETSYDEGRCFVLEKVEGTLAG